MVDPKVDPIPPAKPVIGEAEIEAAVRVLRSGMVIQGPEVAAFEEEISAIAERHGLAIVEDAAQAHMASLHGRPAGAWGVAGCFSFYPTKNMHSLEGGMISTNDAQVARTLRLLRNQGMEKRYANEIV